MKGTSPVDAFCTEKVPVPSVASFNIVLFARVFPAGKLIVLVPGTEPFPGKRVRDPAVGGATTVTLTESETAVSGMPQTPVTVTFRRTPATSAGPPSGPSELRVSRILQGATV